MNREARRMLARIKAYKLEGRSHGWIARRLDVSENVVAGLIYRDRWGKGVGPRERAPKVTFAERTERGYEIPKPRVNDCERHIELIARANNGKGFPVLNIPALYRRAA